MEIFYTSRHLAHDPPEEIYDGVRADYAERPDRIERIADTLRSNGYTLNEPRTFGDEHILSIHQTAYVNFVRSRSEQLNDTQVLFPSYFMSDTYAPLVHGTFAAAKSAVNTALSGAEALLNGASVAYSLCRPPGHHAAPHSLGGYCYFNNAAIAANYLAKNGRVAILDIDYHHGNGTQEAFYDRADVLYVSLHADPATAYPYASGFSEESGRGEGVGFTVNIPLPEHTSSSSYIAALDSALQQIKQFDPQYYVVSVGFDTYVNDPIGGLNLSEETYKIIGQRIANIKAPTLLIQEGGYNVEVLGDLAHKFLQAFS